jgi:hypothetical protein
LSDAAIRHHAIQNFQGLLHEHGTKSPVAAAL